MLQFVPLQKLRLRLQQRHKLPQKGLRSLRLEQLERMFQGLRQRHPDPYQKNYNNCRVRRKGVPLSSERDQKLQHAMLRSELCSERFRRVGILHQDLRGRHAEENSNCYYYCAVRRHRVPGAISDSKLRNARVPCGLRREHFRGMGNVHRE